MQFEPLELHVVDALGQQEVPDYFQQPAKAITEDVSVMRGPYALEWIYAVREEIESFKRLGAYEEVPKGSATSTPLPARLILVTKPNIHGGPARKKARIVICGNFQEVHPDEFTASKTPSYPALRMALSVASHMGWPIECWVFLPRSCTHDSSVTGTPTWVVMRFSWSHLRSWWKLRLLKRE